MVLPASGATEEATITRKQFEAFSERRIALIVVVMAVVLVDG